MISQSDVVRRVNKIWKPQKERRKIKSVHISLKYISEEEIEKTSQNYIIGAISFN